MTMFVTLKDKISLIKCSMLETVKKTSIKEKGSILKCPWIHTVIPYIYNTMLNRHFVHIHIYCDVVIYCDICSGVAQSFRGALQDILKTTPLPQLGTLLLLSQLWHLPFFATAPQLATCCLEEQPK